MNEQFLHYVWQQKLFMSLPQQTTDHRRVEVIDVGRRNTDGGPDFFNAKVRIDGTTWAGNVEIHLRSSDWMRHNHQADRSYDSVILHVVQQADCEVFTTDGRPITQMELRYNPSIATCYDAWLRDRNAVPCRRQIGEIPSLIVTSWKNNLLAERLQQKADSIGDLLRHSGNSWEEAFYVSLARNFGFHTNSVAFELLAKSLPLSFLGKHKDNLLQVEALLFGQAGLLQDAPDDYSLRLQQEYRFLQHKFSLTPIDGNLWKMLRMRPGNFPHVRIAQFARLIHGSTHLFSRLVDQPDYQHVSQLFQVSLDGYWLTHYRFGTPAPERRKSIGKRSVDVLLINTVAPYLFVYGHAHQNPQLQEAALNLLEAIPPEQNHITTLWHDCGLQALHAADSQALIQLYERYCCQRRCLQCRIGHQVLKKLQD